jgi:hypothetical protein
VTVVTGPATQNNTATVSTGGFAIWVGSDAAIEANAIGNAVQDAITASGTGQADQIACAHNYAAGSQMVTYASSGGGYLIGSAMTPWGPTSGAPSTSGLTLIGVGG